MTLLGQSKDRSENALTEVVHGKVVDTMIGLPSWQGGLDADTQICLDKLCHYNIINGEVLQIKKCLGSVISENRNNIIKSAIKTGARYVLFIDTDMIFPPSAIQQLRSHGNRVMSGLAFAKQIPFVPNMYDRVEVGGWKPIVRWKERLRGDSPLLKVDCIGGAFMLIKVDCLKKIPPPWFAAPSVKEHVMHEEVDKLFNSKVKHEVIFDRLMALQRKFEHLGRETGEVAVLGEDYYFSEKCRRANIPIYVDTSLLLGHIGRYIYSYADFADQAERGMFDKEAKDIGLTEVA